MNEPYEWYVSVSVPVFSLFFIFLLIISIQDDNFDEIEKRRVSRGRVIDELIQTEVDFYKVMKLLYDVYLGPLSEATVFLTIKFKKKKVFNELKLD